MSTQPPWPGFPEQTPEQSAQPNGQPNGQQYGQPPAQPNGQQYGQPNGQQYGQQYGQPPAQPNGQPNGQPPANPYAQPQFAYPGGVLEGPRKESALPWIIGGLAAAVVVVLVVVFLVLTTTGILGGSGAGSVSQSATKAATFSYPSAWQVKDESNVTVIEAGGGTPAERFVVLNQTKDASAMAVYQASAKPAADKVSREKIVQAINTGLQGQLDASQNKLVDMRSTSGFGCVSDFAYTEKPAIVDPDKLYGYSYGYTCLSYKGPIQGEYLVAYDSVGVARRLTGNRINLTWKPLSNPSNPPSNP